LNKYKYLNVNKNGQALNNLSDPKKQTTDWHTKAITGGPLDRWHGIEEVKAKRDAMLIARMKTKFN
jgi:hypothetical protein